MWEFNGDLQHPTFNPSLFTESGPIQPGDPNHICHSYLHAGQWRFLDDCTHELKNQVVPMVAFLDKYRV